jgi:hypothetical protein
MALSPLWAWGFLVLFPAGCAAASVPDPTAAEVGNCGIAGEPSAPPLAGAGAPGGRAARLTPQRLSVNALMAMLAPIHAQASRMCQLVALAACPLLPAPAAAAIS